MNNIVGTTFWIGVIIFYVVIISDWYNFFYEELKRVNEQWKQVWKQALKRLSIQYLMILSLSIVVIIFLIIVSLDVLKITPNNAELLFTNTVNILLGLVAFFTIFYSILSSQYYVPLSERYKNKRLRKDYRYYQGRMKKQVAVMLVFLTIIILAVICDFLIPCMNSLFKV